jgi:hypothetical protein
MVQSKSRQSTVGAKHHLIETTRTTSLEGSHYSLVVGTEAQMTS